MLAPQFKAVSEVLWPQATLRPHIPLISEYAYAAYAPLKTDFEATSGCSVSQLHAKHHLSSALRPAQDFVVLHLPELQLRFGFCDIL